MYRTSLLFLCILFSYAHLFAQDSLPAPEKNKYNLSELFHESGLLIKQPGKWKGCDWIKLGSVGVITFSLMQVDENVRRFALDHPKYAKSIPMEVGNQWGGFYFIPVTALALYAFGSLAHHHGTKKLGFEIAQAALYSEAISFVSKGLIGRSRPFLNEGAFDYKPFTFFDGPQNSFPAGHVDAAVALSTVLSKNAHSGFLKVIAYIPAGLTIAARVYQDSHWTSDVFVGGVIGYAVGSWVVNLHEKKESRIQVSSVYPVSVKIFLDRTH